MKRNVPLLALAGAAVLAGITIAVIPVPTPMIDFSQQPGADAPVRNTGHAATIRNVPATIAADPAETSPAKYRRTAWSDLVPKEWDPVSQTRALQRDLSSVPDSDPRVIAKLKQLNEVWDNAPTVTTMDGALVRIPGYVVPLETARAGTREFLLVPYFGACIHAPPPPSNQIVHVLVNPAGKTLRSMDAVWVSGTLSVNRNESMMGTSSYQLDAGEVEDYVAR